MLFEKTQHFGGRLRVLVRAVIGRNNLLAGGTFHVRTPIGYHAVARLRRVTAALVTDYGVVRNAARDRHGVNCVYEAALRRKTIDAVRATLWFQLFLANVGGR